MKKEIAEFNRAATEFKKATAALHPKVEAALNRCNTVEELQELVDRLPTSYIGTRRIYEKMDRIEDKH